MIDVRAFLLGLAAAGWCSAVSAAEPDGSSTAARSHFEAGLSAVGRGEIAQGLREFEAAYAAEPRFAVLFNIGQAQLALERPLEAIASFERFLAEGGQQVTEARRAEVTRLIRQSRRLTGFLVLKVESPAEARVWLDGKALASDELSRPVATVVGSHALLYAYGRGGPTELEVRIEPEASTEVAIPRPIPAPVAPAVTDTPLGQLAIACSVAGIEIEVGGRPIGKTPLAKTVGSAAGSVRLRFARAGFEPVVRDVRVTAGVTSSVACSVPLQPTHASVERARVLERRRFVGYGLAGAALASFGAGAAIYGWNQGRYEDWRAARTPERPAVDRAVSIQRADDAALGLTILGAGLSALATWSLLAVD